MRSRAATPRRRWSTSTSRRSTSAGLAVGAGSDAHVAEALGAAYAEIPDFDGPQAFLASLRAGRVVGHHFDAPRRWRPRIIPSVASEH